MVEQNPSLKRLLQQQTEVLIVENIEIVQADARKWLENCQQTFDIVFLDPPFGQDLMGSIVDKLITGDLLREKALIYMEGESGIELSHDLLKEIKQSHAGQVQYKLLALKNGE